MESTAIVTGGSRGLGRAYCVALAAAGFNVVVADLLDTQEAVGDIEAAGGRAIGVHADISSAADNDALAAATVDAFGTIDVLINNAAYFSETTRGSLDRRLDQRPRESEPPVAATALDQSTSKELTSRLGWPQCARALRGLVP